MAEQLESRVEISFSVILGDHVDSLDCRYSRQRENFEMRDDLLNFKPSLLQGTSKQDQVGRTVREQPSEREAESSEHF